MPYMRWGLNNNTAATQKATTCKGPRHFWQRRGCVLHPCRCDHIAQSDELVRQHGISKRSGHGEPSPPLDMSNFQRACCELHSCILHDKHITPRPIACCSYAINLPSLMGSSLVGRKRHLGSGPLHCRPYGHMQYTDCAILICSVWPSHQVVPCQTCITTLRRAPFRPPIRGDVFWGCGNYN